MRLRPHALIAAPYAVVFVLASGAALAQAPQSESKPEAPEAAEGHAGHAHHPEIKLFGRSLGTLAQFGVTLFNFALFAGILGYLLKGALSSAFKARAKDLEEKLSQAERDKADAGRQIQELENRMAGLQQELEGIMAKADADAETEKQRILESAKMEAAQIVAQTSAEIDAQARQAEAALRALVSELVVAGAAQRLEARMQGPAAAKVLDQAIDQVGGAK
jgi:F-type H+-transporting ATPase subunit b